MLLPDHRSSPRLARDALVLRPSAALNRDPTATSGVNDSSQTVVLGICLKTQNRLIGNSWRSISDYNRFSACL